MPEREEHQPRSLRVFLCHSSGDKPLVRNLYERLRSDGFIPWLDEKDLLPGQNWDAEIRKAILDTDVVIVCLSRHSIGKTGFVQKELKYALDVADSQPDGAIFIIPMRLENCEVPERLKHWQWADFFEEEGYERLARALVKRAKEIGSVVSARPSIFGVWFGVSGRLVLSAGDKPGSVKGTYDWKHTPMVGHLDGYVEEKTLKFQWSWDKTRERGNGYLLLNDAFTRLKGGWFYQADAIDLDEAIRGSEAAEELISKWSFSRELTAEIQE